MYRLIYYLNLSLLLIFLLTKLLLLICFLLLTVSASKGQDDETIYFNKFKTAKVDIDFKSEENLFSKSEIRNIIKTGNTDFFNYDEFLLDIQRIEKFYFDNGYIDAKIDTVTSINNEDKEILVKFLITENSPYLIRDINYKGLEFLPGDLKEKLFAEDERLINENNVYNKALVSSESARILSFLQNNGYALANSDPPEIVKFESNNPDLDNKLEINFNYQLGYRYRFGKTIILIKNDKYNIELYDVLNELEYSENDIYSKELLVKSENRLNRIAILENSRIVISDIDTNNFIINLKVLGLIRNKYEIQPEILGYYFSNSFFGGVGISFSDKFFIKNPRTFSAKLRALANSIENYRMELILELFQPHLFNNNKITGAVNLSSSIFSIDDFRIEEIKNKFTFNYELPKHTYLNNMFLDWNIKNQRITFKIPLGTIPEGSFLNLFYSTLGLTLVHSKMDNFQFPTRGIYQSYLLEESGLISSVIKKIFDISTVDYFKFSFINKFYIPLTDNPQKSTLATKFLIGNIFEYGDNTLALSSSTQDYPLGVVPIDSKFIAGGSTSVRGWNARKLGTFDTRDTGGDFILEGTIEHRTRPFFDKKGLIKDFGFVSFLDIGNLWEKIDYYRTSDLAVAIGVGLRYYTIVGPIRFDFGFKLYDYEPANGTNKWLFQNNITKIFQDKFAIQFGIGNTF